MWCCITPHSTCRRADMKIDIFNLFTLETMIFDYSSLEFTRKFRGAGIFSLTLNSLEDYEYLKEDYIMLIGSDAYIIENIHAYNNDKKERTLEITGSHVNKLLSRRVTAAVTINTTATIEAQLLSLVNANFINPSSSARKVSNFTSKSNGITKKATTQYTVGDEKGVTVMEVLNRVCGNSGLGWRVNFLPEEQKFEFEVYEGLNLTSDVFFGEEYGNVSESDLYKQSENYSNVGYREGTFTGTVTGLDRREVILDENTSLSDYKRLISAESVVMNNDQFVYRVDWDLGDTVAFDNKVLGFTVEQPILEIKEIHSNTVDLEVTFGDKIPTIFDKLKKG